MPVVASGFISESLDALRDLIAACDAFRTWIKKPLAADAKTRIGYKGIDADEDGTMEFDRYAVVTDLGSEFPSNSFPHGSFGLRFYMKTDVANVSSHQKAHMAFQNEISAIVREMWSKGSSAGYLMVRSINQVGPTDREDVTEIDDACQAYYEVLWGPSG